MNLGGVSRSASPSSSRRAAFAAAFVQLSLACRENPASAYDLICKGHLETFLAGQGRTDLAAVAHAAASNSPTQTHVVLMNS